MMVMGDDAAVAIAPTRVAAVSMVAARVGGEIRVSHGRDEYDDVAPFAWLNFECLDATTCHSLIG